MSIAARRTERSGSATPLSAGAIEVGATAELASPSYVGLVTRTIAFALDAALINIIALLVAAVVTLGLSVVAIPQGLHTVAAAVAGASYVIWAVAYFATFWATTGQTPGSRALRIRVHNASGAPLVPSQALLRFLGLTLAALPLFAGFLLILVDDRRRGLHDVLARTVVVDVADEALAERSPPPTGRR
jgi:uncharacterized RDD family membrane protein YckC